MHFRFFIIILFLLSAVGCAPIHEEGRPDPVPGPGSLKTKIDFAQIKTEVLDNYCINCHTGRHAAYANYAVVKASATQILERISTTDVNRRMPPRQAPLPADLIAKVKEWVDAGAPELATDTGDGGNPPPVVPSGFGFKDIKKKILEPNCIGCHSHFSDFAIVKGQLGSIFGLVMEHKMPFPRRKNQPVEPLADDLKKMLSAWVNDGAPEIAGQKDQPIVMRPLEPTWLSLRNNVFGPKCILCHNSYGSRAPTKMGTYKEVQEWGDKNKKLFNQESPIDSHFVGAILGRVDDDEEFFDPMPFNSSVDDVPTDIKPVTEAELEVIQKWIELGRPFGVGIE